MRNNKTLYQGKGLFFLVDFNSHIRGRYEITITSSLISLRPLMPLSTLHRYGYFYTTAYRQVVPDERIFRAEVLTDVFLP
jgi:hypothetical protein